MSVALIEVCKAAYAATYEFHEVLKPHLGASDFGYKSLYGPPKARVELLFLGFQPGGGASHAELGAASGERRRWPTTQECLDASYKLARRVRELWPLAAIEDSVALNRIFFRAPGEDKWKEALPAELRKDAEQFCGSWVKQIVEAVRPRRVVILGLKSVKEFKRSCDPVLGDGRVLVRSGELWGISADAVIHPTGKNTHVSALDTEAIRNHFTGTRRFSLR